MTTLNLIVGNVNDDFYVNYSTLSAAGGTVVAFGRTSQSFGFFARFTNATIPNAATINSCVATFNASANRTETTCNALIHFENADNPAAPTTYADFVSRTLTAGTAWNNVPAWTTSTDYNTPDFAAELQTVVNRVGFASGNALNLFVIDNSSSTDARRTPRSYDGSTSLCPRLAIDYTEAADEFTAEAAFTTGGATLSASASHTAPTYTASAVLTTGPTALAADATFAPGTFTATADLSAGPAALAAEATHTAPVYTAEATLTAGAATLAASATFGPPTFTAAADLTAAGTKLAASASHTAPVYTAAADLATAPVAFTASASHTPPTFEATADLAAAAAILAVDASHTPPSFTASATWNVGGASLAAEATFASSVHTATATLTTGPAAFSAVTSVVNPEIDYPSLEAAIHARWLNKTPLATVLPWTSVFTGIAPPDSTLPYCSLTRTSNPLNRRSNTGDVEDVQIRMEVFSESFAAGRAAIEALKLPATLGGWNCDAFRIDQYSAVKAMIFENDYYNQDDDGVWRFVIDWQVKVEAMLTGQVFVSPVGITDSAGAELDLETAVHARWATKAPLEQTLSVSSVFTGIAPPSATLPFASITRTSSPIDRRANKGDIEDIQLRIQVFSSEFDEGRAVVEALKRPTGRGGFNRDSFNIDDRKAVAACLFDNEFYIQEPDGTWQFTIDFNVRTEALLAARN